MHYVANLILPINLYHLPSLVMDLVHKMMENAMRINGYSMAKVKSKKPAAWHQMKPPFQIPKLTTNQSMAVGIIIRATMMSLKYSSS